MAYSQPLSRGRYCVAIPLDAEAGHRPRIAQYSAMAFESKQNRMVLFGGLAGGLPASDTWVFDGNNWTQFADTGPSARSEHAVAYDSTRQRLVLFGGIRSSGSGQSYLGDTWASFWRPRRNQHISRHVAMEWSALDRASGHRCVVAFCVSCWIRQYARSHGGLRRNRRRWDYVARRYVGWIRAALIILSIRRAPRMHCPSSELPSPAHRSGSALKAEDACRPVQHRKADGIALMRNSLWPLYRAS